MILNFVLLSFGAWNLGGLGLLAILVVRYRARVKKALSYCRRAADGEIYVTDPQKGTVHKLSDLLAKRAMGELPPISGRQRKKVRRVVKRAFG